MTQFSVWIEPALINEWVSQMEKYEANKENGFTRAKYLEALHWDNPQRNTTKVRNRIDSLLAEQQVHCVWSGKRLNRSGNYAVDHAISFCPLA